MKMRSTALWFAAALAAASFAVHAATITSVDRAAFQAAIAGGQIDGQDFDGIPNGTLLGTLDGVTYAASTGTPLVTNAFLTSTSPNGLGRTDVGFFLAGDTATFTFADAISAFAIDVNTFATTNGAYQALLSTGDTVTSLFEVFPSQATGQFIGFVTDTPFTSLTISAITGLPYTLDTLVYGDASVIDPNPVPEPATLALLGLGVVVVSLKRRRQHR